MRHTVTGPYPDVRTWLVPQDLLEATRRGVHEGGQCVQESGALWLGQRDEIARLTVVVFPRGKGVFQSAGRWKVTPEVFAAVTRWAKPRSLSLLGVIHTHLPGVPPRLSRADREYSVQVPGILAVVIGEGGAEKDYQSWGWYLFEGGKYRYLTTPDFRKRFVLDLGSHFDVCEVDAGGVRELS